MWKAVLIVASIVIGLIVWHHYANPLPNLGPGGFVIDHLVFSTGVRLP